MEVALEVADLDERRDLLEVELTAVLAQLGRDPRQAERGVDELLALGLEAVEIDAALGGAGAELRDVLGWARGATWTSARMPPARKATSGAPGVVSSREARSTDSGWLMSSKASCRIQKASRTRAFWS